MLDSTLHFLRLEYLNNKQLFILFDFNLFYFEDRSKINDKVPLQEPKIGLQSPEFDSD